MSADSSSSTTPKQIPTVNKVSAMIDDKLTNIVDTKTENQKTTYTIKDSVLSSNIATTSDVNNTINTKLSSIMSNNLSQINGVYQYVASTSTDYGKYNYGVQIGKNCYCNFSTNAEYTINIESYQYDSYAPSIQLRDGDEIIAEFSIDKDLISTNTTYYTSEKQQHYDDNNTEFYYFKLVFYYKDIVFKDTQLNKGTIENDIKLWIEQDGTYYETLTIPFEKQLLSNRYDGGDFIMSFYAFRDLVYPVGSLYMTTNNVNPSQLLGGTWGYGTNVGGNYVFKRTA